MQMLEFVFNGVGGVVGLLLVEVKYGSQLEYYLLKRQNAVYKQLRIYRGQLVKAVSRIHIVRTLMLLGNTERYL